MGGDRPTNMWKSYRQVTYSRGLNISLHSHGTLLLLHYASSGDR